MKRGKGQYSLEFLITYGWAILILGVIVGVIYAFGWIDAANYMPQKCDFYGQIGCRDFYLSEESFNLSLVNNFGVGLVIHGVSIIENGIDVCNISNQQIVWPRSDAVQVGINLTNCNNFFVVPGRRADLLVQVSFYSNKTCSECWDDEVNCPDCLYKSTGRVLARVLR